MRYRSRDIHILLGSLFIFSGVMTVLHGVKNNQMQNTGLDTLSPKNAVWQLSPLITSRSVEKIAESLSNISPQEARDIIQEIIDKQAGLKRNDLLELIFALALQYPSQLEKQSLFFDLFYKNKDVYTHGAPILFVAAKSNYQRVVPALLEWAQKKSEQLLNTLTKDTLWYIIKNDEFTEFARLYDYGLFITPKLATQLLWHVVDHNDSSKFVPFLVNAGADINYVHNNKYTPLIRATELNNYLTVKEILKAIKRQSKNKKSMFESVNMIPDPAVGSALQIAVRNQFGEIDLLLREYGARE